MPGPIITGVNISAEQIVLGNAVAISVSGSNSGDAADMQIVSVGFPNLTSVSEIEILRSDFRQTPFKIEPGDQVGSNYEGTTSVSAQYPSIEAYSRPWERGSNYSIDLQVRPQIEGKFVVYVKSVAFPHSWDGAHYPGGSLLDYQGEFVQYYSVQVTKS